MKGRSEEPVPESDALDHVPHPRHANVLHGHTAAQAMLLDAFRTQKLPQSWIFGGPEGIGKATLAWHFARFLLARGAAPPGDGGTADLSVPTDHPAARRVAALSHGNLFVLRREWNDKTKKHFTDIRIDDVRRALLLFQKAPTEEGWRICIIDSADDLNASSANALLKLIEEPPPRSLFLMVSHRPGRILPTIRSRSRLLNLSALSTPEVAAAVRGLGEPWTTQGDELDVAAGASRGSVRQALRLLDRERSLVSSRVARLLERLPDLDRRAVFDLADKVSGTAADDTFEQTIEQVFEWLDDRVHIGGSHPARLAPYALVWEKVADAVRETKALNLDKRPLILSIFSDLAAAARGDMRENA